MIEILNRQAKFNYEILDTIETGIVLTGTEIKSLKLGNANIKDSYATIRNNEVFLLKVYFVKGHAKILLGLARGKKTYDKRETIKKRDVEREIRKEFKEKNY